ncbi:hypothetical protein RB2654_15230 [Rhodobacterales bacterium HTCC2654]|uniref:Uncharacterized protein n=1 Tax=Maritimibacter alkaliphilus HTCC2654 TaxID=314271 RepID=A3VH95_9RHOB|nr:hypothetical protein RB2654_15230 [Rhodobacterales bacterium HTCC2654] [Maritimibacter alkaliphilus HTCC2654]
MAHLGSRRLGRARCIGGRWCDRLGRHRIAGVFDRRYRLARDRAFRSGRSGRGRPARGGLPCQLQRGGYGQCPHHGRDLRRFGRLGQFQD